MHIFAIRVDGTFDCYNQTNNTTVKLVVDTYFGTANSYTRFVSNVNENRKIEVIFKAFDIEAYKSGSLPNPTLWNAIARSYYADNAPVFQVERTVTGDRRYNTYQQAINGNTQVVTGTSTPVSDGAGVLGRYSWDHEQMSLGLVTMGRIEVLGMAKTTMAKLTADALKNATSIAVNKTLVNWRAGDSIVISLSGNHDASNNGNDEGRISSISGNTINLSSGLKKNHQGRLSDNLHCYVGNLSRNIVFKSFSKVISHRGHLMIMHNDSHIVISNAVFRDMGRTDKSRLLDDFIWKQWLEPPTFKSKISPLGQECALLERNPNNEIVNSRGRYSIHIHRTGVTPTTNKAIISGNVIWGNPGWGITQHHSYADVLDNVVYDVTGSGIVSESGSELGNWDNNFIIGISKGHLTDDYDAAVFYDDYLYDGSGLGLKGRGVVCNHNVIADANIGLDVANKNPTLTNLDRVDAKALAVFRPGFQFDQFPLSTNGYSSEGDGVLPQEVALLSNDNTIINVYIGLRSIERDMGVNHVSRSVFDSLFIWGAVQGITITYQADYSFRHVYVSGKNTSTSVGLYLWKHSHNHYFEDIKLANLRYGITVSKLVEQNNGLLKTRNNGFTPWYLVNLTTQNVQDLYEISLEEPGTISYTEHGDNTIILPSSDLKPRPTTFTIVDSSLMTMDWATNDLRFEVDGIISDRLGAIKYGIEQAPAQGDERLDYPSRIYEFASKAKLEEYISNNGLYTHPITGAKYIIVYEYIPDRSTYLYTRFPIRVIIKNPPATGVFANPIQEDPSNFGPQLTLLSQFAAVSQKSTRTNLSYNGVAIDCGPQKARDNNNNGRINVNYYQQGLVPVGSFSSTTQTSDPWYDLDLKSTMDISYIDIWNTVELNGSAQETPSTGLQNFYVFFSNTPFGNTSVAGSKAVATDSLYYGNGVIRKISWENIGKTARYVRIQAVGNKMLKMAEVEIIGKKAQPCGLVSNKFNTGFGSLRNTIGCINGYGTVTFHPSLGGDTIFVSEEMLSVNKSLTIDGGASPVFVAIQSAVIGDHLFSIGSGNTVTLRNVNLLLGNNFSQEAIDNNGQLILENVNIYNCRTNNTTPVIKNASGASLQIKSQVKLLGTPPQ